MDFSDNNHRLQNYLEAYISPGEEILGELSRYTYLKVGHPNMLSGPIQGKFLEFVSKMINPDRILEIGAFTGYSAICLARGLKDGGKIITLEVNDELRRKALEFFDLAGLSDKIELINGDAIKIIPTLNEMFDLIFIDGEKEEYSNYYKLCFPKLRTGGFILTDNVLWDGKVLEDKAEFDSATKAIDDFNRMIREDENVESMILPIRDGVSIIRKI